MGYVKVIPTDRLERELFRRLYGPHVPFLRERILPVLPDYQRPDLRRGDVAREARSHEEK